MWFLIDVGDLWVVYVYGGSVLYFHPYFDTSLVSHAIAVT